MIPASQVWQARAQAGAGGASNFVILFSIAGYSRIFTTAPTGQANHYPWISDGNAGSLTISVSDLDASCNVSDLSFTVVDYNRLITQDFQQGINIIGATCTIQVGFVNMAESDYITLSTLIVDHVDLANQNTSYKITLRDNSLLMQQFSFQTANDGFPTGRNHLATVQGSPMAILEEAVIQSGLPLGNINTQAIQNLNTNVYFGQYFYFNVSYPPRAKDFIENEILKPLGGYWFWNYLGQLTPFSMLPYDLPVSELTLDETTINLATPPVPLRSQDYTAVIIYKMDGDTNGQNFQTDIVGEYAPAVNLYGISQSRIIQSRGVRSTLGGARIAYLTMQNIFNRYGFKPFMMTVKCFLPAMRLEISDKVTVTHPMIPNGMWPAKFRMSGPLGITGTLWEVLSKTVDFNDGSVTLKMIDVSWQIQNGVWEIAPDGTGPYSSSTQYMYYCGANDKYSNGDDARDLY